MIDQGKKNIIGVLVDAVDYEAAVNKIITAAQNKKSLIVSALAVHGVMTGVLDSQHRHRLNQFDLITPDGQPVRWALNLLYKAALPDRVYGPTLMIKVCEAATQRNIPIYFYGSELKVLEQLVQNLKMRFPDIKIAGYQPSKFRRVSAAEMVDIATAIDDSGAGIVLVGLGCPRQEVWAYEYKTLLQMPVLAVGAAFDFHAGTLPQAPATMQQLGLEWFYRLSQEPKRLWKRYAYLNPLFLVLLLSQSLRLCSFDTMTTTPPINEMRYG